MSIKKHKTLPQKTNIIENKIPLAPTGRPKYKKGDIYLAKVYYQDKPKEYKERPVLVMHDEKNGKILACSITGQAAKVRSDYPLENWKTSGLKKPSVAETGRFISIPLTDINHKIGTISDHDMNAVQTKRLEKRKYMGDRAKTTNIETKNQSSRRDILLNAPPAQRTQHDFEYE